MDQTAGARTVRVALYARVSTSDQTVENQLSALREHAMRAGWVVIETYIDRAVSGTRERRPGLDALLADGRRRRYDLIAVAALDRLGRNLRHLVVLLDELQHLGIGLISLREALDLTSPIGRAMFALVGVLAEVERAWIVERTHAGLRRARAQGKQIGRPPILTDHGELRALLAAGSSCGERQYKTERPRTGTMSTPRSKDAAKVSYQPLNSGPHQYWCSMMGL